MIRALVVTFSLICLGLFSAPASAQVLWGSSSGEQNSTNDGSLFTINTSTGAATLIGPTGLLTPQGFSAVSAIAFDPITGVLYGILGGATNGAQLITINRTTGAGTVVGPLVGAGFNQASTNSGSDSLAFAPDGTLYAGGWGTGRLLRIDKATGAVLANFATPGGAHLAGLSFSPTGVLWASRGGNAPGLVHTVNPATGAFLSTLPLSEPVRVNDLAFRPDGVLFASLGFENQLATIKSVPRT